MDDRVAAARSFVDAAGWRDGRITPLSGDASFRRYFRVVAPSRTAILMDAPPGREDVRPFVRVDETLRAFGYSAPAILACDASQGFLLLEDLGDELYARVLEQGGDERTLYAASIDLLRDLAERPVPNDLPVFDLDRGLREVRLLLEWTLPALRGEPVERSAAEEFDALWRATLAGMFEDPQVVALFDYHAENLVWLPERDGLARVGLLDFQDAVIGPAAYDIVSLLEDARRDVPAGLVEAMIDRYLAGSPDDARRAFRAAYALAGAQRNTRIIGVFGRLYLRDGKAGYLKLMPRVWRHLEADLKHPILDPLRDWFARNVPEEWRSRAPDPGGFALP